MRTKAVIVLTALLLLAWSGPAAAKGMSGGTIEGEGLDEPIATFGSRTPGAERIVDDTGIYETIWTTSPRRTVDEAPTDALGPNLTIRWSLMGPDGDIVIVQEIYPYADGGPLTYTAAGQPLFGSDATVGGWFRAPDRLVTTLQAMGVPDEATLTADAGGRGPAWAPIGGSLAAVVVLGVGLALVGRRRREVAPAVG